MATQVDRTSLGSLIPPCRIFVRSLPLRRRIKLETILSNPAELILHTNQISFQVIYQSVLVGRAYVDPLDLYQGEFALFASSSRDRTQSLILLSFQEPTPFRPSSTTW